jgi:signal transduction histidine kinase
VYLHFSRLWVKLASFICLAISVIAIPALYLDYQWDLQMATEAYVHHLHGAALAVKAVIKQEPDAASMQAVLNEAVGDLRHDEMRLMEHQAPSFEVFQAYVVGPDALVRASTEPAWIGRPIAEAVGHQEQGLMEILKAEQGYSYQVMTHGGIEVLDLSIPLSTGALHLAGDYEPVKALAGSIARHRLYLTLALLLVLVLALNAVMGRWVILPVQRLAQAMQRGPEAEVPVSTNDEIGVLGESFNQMATEIRRKTGELEQANQKLSTSYEQLLQADKMATLGLMAGTVAHDIANPLSLISGHADLLIRTRQPDDRIRESCETIKQGVDKIERLISSIRNFSRKSAGQRLPVDVRRPIEEALLLVSKALTTANIQVVKEYGEGSLLVPGDANQLEQVFMNLIQNAAQAMPKGGQLTIRAKAAGDQVEVSISDTGCGIPEEHLGRIFDSFFSTKGEKGTGLGLAICKRIVEEHGGKVEARSQVGAGTTMRVALPAAPAEETRT